MTETTYASNIDDLVAEIGKLRHKRRVAADMISEMIRFISDTKVRDQRLIQDINKLYVENKDLRKQVDQIPNLKNKLCMLVPKVNQQRGEIEALKWTIKELTKK